MNGALKNGLFAACDLPKRNLLKSLVEHAMRFHGARRNCKNARFLLRVAIPHRNISAMSCSNEYRPFD